MPQPKEDTTNRTNYTNEKEPRMTRIRADESGEWYFRDLPSIDIRGSLEKRKGDEEIIGDWGMPKPLSARIRVIRGFSLFHVCLVVWANRPLTKDRNAEGRRDRGEDTNENLSASS